LRFLFSAKKTGWLNMSFARNFIAELFRLTIKQQKHRGCKLLLKTALHLQMKTRNWQHELGLLFYTGRAIAQLVIK
jgi:hypothetical protein